MPSHRAIHDPGGIRPESAGGRAGAYDHRPATRSSRLAVGTLACPACDAPVLPGRGPMIPMDRMRCPVCHEAGAVRDFLSLATPARPARVVVRVIRPAPGAPRRQRQ
ncbi:MAG: hypothetical protein JWN65_2262 [Solirubrobacterales bacterium]|nr:hypothetical protein [Solirubrobacterales bacterium]